MACFGICHGTYSASVYTCWLFFGCYGSSSPQLACGRGGPWSSAMWAFPLCPTCHDVLPTAAGLCHCKVQIRITFTLHYPLPGWATSPAWKTAFSVLYLCTDPHLLSLKAFWFLVFIKGLVLGHHGGSGVSLGTLGVSQPKWKCPLKQPEEKAFLCSQGQVLQAIASVIKWIGIQDVELLLGISSWVSPSRALLVISE